MEIAQTRAFGSEGHWFCHWGSLGDAEKMKIRTFCVLLVVVLGTARVSSAKLLFGQNYTKLSYLRFDYGDGDLGPLVQVVIVSFRHRHPISLMEALCQRFDHLSLFLQAAARRDVKLEYRDRDNHFKLEERRRNEILSLSQVGCLR